MQNNNLSAPSSGQILRGTNIEQGTVAAANATWERGGWRASGATGNTVEKVPITDCPDPNVRWGWRLRASGNGGNPGVVQESIPLALGMNYIARIWVRKISGNPRLRFYPSNPEGGTGGDYAGIFNMDITNTDWQMFYKPVRVTGAGTNAVLILVGAAAYAGEIEVCGELFVLGRTPTAYGENLFDVEQRVKDLLTPQLLWQGNEIAAGTVLTLNNNINNYREILFQVDTPGRAPGYTSIPIRRWLESASSWNIGGSIALPTVPGYVQLVVVSTTELRIGHADSHLRAIHGVLA